MSATELKRILSAKEWFKVFDVPSSSNITEVRVVFRQLALRVHPDKNSAPEATEAFKRLAQALEKATLECSPSSSSSSNARSNNNNEGEGEEERKGFCWWEQDWQFIEQWIKRQEEDFERENARHKERLHAQQAVKRQKQKAANERVQQGLAQLKAKHGLGPLPPPSTVTATTTTSAAAATNTSNSFAHNNNNSGRRGRFVPPSFDDGEEDGGGAGDFQSARLRIELTQDRKSVV